MLTKFLKNPNNRIKLLNVLLGKSQGCPVANLKSKCVTAHPTFQGENLKVEECFAA